MQIKMVFASALTAVLFISALSGCTSKDQESEKNKHDVFATMVTDVGGITDQAFNQAAYEDGLMRIKSDLKLGVNYIESSQNADYSSNIDKATDQKPRIVWGVGYKLADAMASIAKDNPSQQYGLIDYTYDDEQPNIISIDFCDNESACLIGYLSAALSKSGNIGFIGGMPFKTIDRFRWGYTAGAQLYAKESGQDVSVVAQYVNSFTDLSKGKDIAINMCSSNCDVIYCAAGAVGQGVLEAVKERNKLFMGVDRDQSPNAPDNIPASSIKNVGRVMFDISNDIHFEENHGVSGKNITLGLADDAVGIAFGCGNLVDENMKSKVKNLEEQIISGGLSVPENEEEYQKFLKKISNSANQPKL